MTTKARQLTYMERTARFPLDFTIMHDDESGLPEVKVSAKWENENLVRVGPFSTGALKFSPRVNRWAAASVFEKFFRAVIQAGVLPDVISYDGGYIARLKRGITAPPAGASKDVWGKQLSNHSRGTAIDLNAKFNGMGHPGAELGKPGSLARIIAIARTIRVEVESPIGTIWDAGIVCGADWKGASIDPMHFEVGTWEPT